MTSTMLQNNWLNITPGNKMNKYLFDVQEKPEKLVSPFFLYFFLYIYIFKEKIALGERGKIRNSMRDDE